VRRTASGRVADVQFKNGRLSASSVPLAILVSIAYNVPFQGRGLKGIDPGLSRRPTSTEVDPAN
jgi:DNA topoisomerase VI subunit B